jgi:hypothetical protein
MNISPELPGKIQNAIDEFAAGSEPFLVTPDAESENKVNLRELAAELNVLPVTFDWFACWAVRPSGEIILIEFEKPYIIKTETNQKIINMVFFEAAKNYSELKELKPARNPESITCPGCDGTGILREFAHIESLAISVRCNCGGVGWLPGADSKYLYF